MTDTDDVPKWRRLPRWLVVSCVVLLTVAVVIGGGVGFYRLGVDAGRAGGFQTAPPTDISFWWDGGPNGEFPMDHKFDLVRAWVESHILTHDFDAAYPGFAEATHPQVSLDFGFANQPDARIGLYELKVAAFQPGAAVTIAQVCVDGLRAASVYDGKPLKVVHHHGWYAVDLTFQRPVEVDPSHRTTLGGDLPGHRATPPPDVFGDWVATSATPTRQSQVCALWWAERYGVGGRHYPANSVPNSPGDVPGW